MHSTTKYIGGHSDVVGGALLTNDEELDAAFGFLQNGAGAVPGPFDAYLTMRGLKTLVLRMQRHSENAALVAEFLDGHPAIEKVLYPGLPSHPGHEVAARQMSGFGGMVSVRLRGGAEAARDFCSRTEVFILAESLGGVESLIEHPGAMTHASTAGSQLEVPDDLVRLSVGIEDSADLLADLEQAPRLARCRIADAVTARFTSGSAVSVLVNPTAAGDFACAGMCTHRHPRSLRLSSAPRPSTACSSEMIAAVGGVGGSRSNSADNSAARACVDPLPVGQRPRIRMAESLGVQPNYAGSARSARGSRRCCPARRGPASTPRPTASAAGAQQFECRVR